MLNAKKSSSLILTALLCCYSSLSVYAQDELTQEEGRNALSQIEGGGNIEMPDGSTLRKENETAFIERDENASPLSEQVEDLKKAALELNRDLLILEEDLLFPANTQIMVYISMDVGEYFSMDAVRLMIDGEMVATHLYTEKQNSALIRGGIQRLYLGNLKTGEHEITAIFHGYGPGGREYKRGASLTIEKDQSPTLLEIKVRDSVRKMQPTFQFKKWNL